MPRFSAKSYKPEQDSSRGCAKRAHELGAVVLVQKTRWVDSRTTTPCKQEDEHAVLQKSCPCGCGEFTANHRTHFKMGHDARFRGKLIRAHMTDTPIVFVLDGQEHVPEPAESLAPEYGQSFVDAIQAATGRRDDANKALLQKAKGSHRLIKVGRWETTGQVVAVFEKDGGEQFEIEYVTKTGETKRTRVPADKAPLAKKEQIEKAKADAEAAQQKKAEPAAA